MVPSALQCVPQWVAWKLVVRNGKSTKVPVNPHTGRNASSTEPRTWGTYADALQAVRRFGLSGVGFVFSPDDLFAGIDLDGCRDPDSGAIDGWAEDIIRKLDSFTEISPSGRGVHIIIRADKPEGRCVVGGVEIYDHGRFFCVTGNHLDWTPEYVEDRQDAFNALFRDVSDGASPRSTSPRKRRGAPKPTEPVLIGSCTGLRLYRYSPALFV